MAPVGREPTVARLTFYTRQYSRIVKGWVGLNRLDPEHYVPTLCDAAIRKILNACKEDNKLVLTRIMEQEEERLDLSIEAIQREAEQQAVDAVVNILPLEESRPPEQKKKSWVKRLFGWLGFASSAR